MKTTKLMTRRDVAAMLRVKPERIDVFVLEHGFPIIHLPGGKRRTIRFDRESVTVWLKKREASLPE